MNAIFSILYLSSIFILKVIFKFYDDLKYNKKQIKNCINILLILIISNIVFLFLIHNITINLITLPILFFCAKLIYSFEKILK
jgi:hypothetical protein